LREKKNKKAKTKKVLKKKGNSKEINRLGKGKS
jgi:hypothetical protein